MWPIVLLAACAGRPDTPQPPSDLVETAALPQGITVGGVTARTARLWTRADARTVVHWEVTTEGEAPLVGSIMADEDGVAVVPSEALRLEPATAYGVRMWGATTRGPTPPDDAARASFTTAPPPDAAASLTLAWSGDLGGQNVCRDAERGYPIFDAIRGVEPDLFVALGDMIYADGVCRGTGAYGNAQVPGTFGEAEDREGYLAHWWYNLADPAFVRLRSEVPVVPVWDDHEIVNDSGPNSAGADRLPIAEAALRTAWPLQDDRPLYRKARWGAHAELFLLDTRSHRAAHTARDDRPTPKSLLGEDQREWLLDGLKRSDTTWKIVVSSVPMALPTGQRGARDGWADMGDGTGYERELAAILGALRLEEITGVVFLTADVHHAEGFRITPFPDRPDLAVHELVAGPLSAGVFPADRLDPTLGAERLFVHQPPSADAVVSYEQALTWFNFGVLEIAEDGTATARILDANGRQVASVVLDRG